MIAEPLDLTHWPKPRYCPQCRSYALYVAGDVAVCTSPKCDPGARSWLALDRWYRNRAGKPPLAITAEQAPALRARRDNIRDERQKPPPPKRQYLDAGDVDRIRRKARGRRKSDAA
ncbi:MAG TPA: hypothetical protein VE338_06830 [Ktedonobacterales bacterium]|nr:hypothetical protein [Ktedonobacterales bacterium]